jgi:hypothetical protein
MGAPGPGFHPERPRPCRPQARLAAGHVHPAGIQRRDAGAREDTPTSASPAAPPPVTPAPGGNAAPPPQPAASRNPDLAHHLHRHDHRRGDPQPRRSSPVPPSIRNLRRLAAPAGKDTRPAAVRTLTCATGCVVYSRLVHAVRPSQADAAWAGVVSTAARLLVKKPASFLGQPLAGTPSDAPRALVRCRVASHDLSLRLEPRCGVSVGLLHFQGGNAAGWRHRIVEAGPGASSGHLLTGDRRDGHSSRRALA